MGAAVNLLIGGPSLVYCVIFALLRTDLVERGTKMCTSRLRGSSKNEKGGEVVQSLNRQQNRTPHCDREEWVNPKNIQPAGQHLQHDHG